MLVQERTKHMHCKKKRHNCKQKCNAECNDEMLTCLEPKYDDNDNLLGAGPLETCCNDTRNYLVNNQCENDNIVSCIDEFNKKYKDCLTSRKFESGGQHWVC